MTGSKRKDMLELAKSGRSIHLCDYDEDTQREYIQTLAHMYKHAKVGDPQFIEICQGRAEPCAKRNELFSTCGEFAHFLLERMGYRGRILNRDLFDLVSGVKIQKWKQRKNLAYLFYRGRKEGAFVEYLLSKNKSKRPNTGDVVYVSNSTAKKPAPNTEHVFYFDGHYMSAESELYGETQELWVTIDGGQGGRKSQHIGEGTKAFDQNTGRVYKWRNNRKVGKGRKVIGWLNPILLEFTAPAHLRSPK